MTRADRYRAAMFANGAINLIFILFGIFICSFVTHESMWGPVKFGLGSFVSIAVAMVILIELSEWVARR